MLFKEVGKPYPLSAGSCTFHHGRMLHYSRGNTTDRQRRAYVTNFRPREMIEFERKNNYDHGKDMVFYFFKNSLTISIFVIL